MKQHISNEMKRYNHLLGEIEATYHESSLKLGISDSVSKILYTICISGGSCLLSDICKKTGLSKQTIHSAIRNLQNDDVIYLTPIDGKSKKICLTENGKIFVKNTALRIVEMENNIFASWEKTDIEKYLQLTEKFLKSLKDKVHQL